MIGLKVDFDPQIASAMKDLNKATRREEKSILKTLVDLAPSEMRSLMDSAVRTGRKGYRAGGKGSFTRSAKGEVPAMDSFELYNSIRAKMEGRTLVLEFAEHAKYLDPVFEGTGEEGGYLGRPWIERSLENAVKKLEAMS